MKIYIKAIVFIFSLIVIVIISYLIINWMIAKEIRESQEKGIIQLEQDVFYESFLGQIVLIDKNCISLKNIQDTNEYIPPLRIISETNSSLSVGDTLFKESNSNKLKMKKGSIHYYFEYDINCYQNN